MTKMTTGERTALVLGANGGVGGEIAAALLARGWHVTALVRDPALADRRWSAAVTPDWVKGDAMDRESVVSAAADASVIVHAVNPPGYRDWDRLVLPMIDNTIAAASACGARIVLPGTIYNFGPDVFDRPLECVPQNPTTRKGAIRAEMESRLRDAATAGTPSLVVRCGDFFGPNAANNWFSQGLVKPGRPVHSISYPGDEGVGHQWAYLPDVGETVARLLDREEELSPFEVFHMEGHWDPDGTRIIAAIRNAAGNPDIPVRRFPWWLVTLASPVVALFRELLEVRYLWRIPLRMTNRKLVGFLGEEPHTDWDTAMRRTLAGLGCLTV
ncbi:NAD(P)H-binding protein [Arvimicrobium flavum]|uniref:NAD(P)H-binding protein n=1 Tax=Arvimicrobium flavum TaxID=3393320 RepID=UPI00237A0EDD|nr:NAD(P)H-binding protein [Mesorhizobium shangrilense]